LTQFTRRILSAYRRHGAIGFSKQLWKNLRHYSRQLISGRRHRPDGRQVSEFDQAHGTDTELIREIGSLDIPAASAKDANRYQPSPHRLAKKLIQSLDIDHAKYTFIDYGAGKGRVLLIAAELPFCEVVGIELSKELCDIASQNISSLDSATLAAGIVTCKHIGATAFTLPDTPLVCYFYNPFGASVIRVVSNNLAASLKANPRDAYIIYMQPEHRDVFESSGCWEIAEDDEFHVIYRARPSCDRASTSPASA
jgi:predicted RNA methylase